MANVWGGYRTDTRGDEFKDLISGLTSRVEEKQEGGEFELPEFSQEKLSRLAQPYMQAGLSKLGRVGRENIVSAGPSPFARAYATRQAQRGIGEGLSDVSVGATQAALARYLPEYKGQLEKARAEFAGEETKRASDLSNLLQYYSGLKEEFYQRPTAREEVVRPERGGVREPVRTLDRYEGKYSGQSDRDYLISKAREEGWSAEQLGGQLRLLEGGGEETPTKRESRAVRTPQTREQRERSVRKIREAPGVGAFELSYQ